jgi:hypothetical protein
VQVGFFPLDQELKLVKHSWTPETIEQAIGMGVDIPSMRRAAKRFEGLTKVPMSKSSLAALVSEYGGQLVAVQEKEAQEASRLPAKGEAISQRALPEPDAPVMALSMDGVMINMRGEGWKEAKVASISVVEAVQEGTGEEPKVQLSRHSYRAGLWDAAAFAKQQWAEACRRGLAKAQKLVCVSDGAVWIWNIILTCYASCIQVIDWWHAVEKLWEIGGILLGEGSNVTEAWVKHLKDLLWAGDMRSLLHEIRSRCPEGVPLPDRLGILIGYLYRHRGRMTYQAFRAAGYPVGSGTVESGCKVVVQARMTGAGMRWSRAGAQAMLALRCLLLSERWDAEWTSMFPTLSPA